MLIVSTHGINSVMQALVGAIHSSTDHHGDRIVHPTIDPDALRQAALAALGIASRDVVWPSDSKLLKRRDDRLPFITEI